MLAKLPQRNLPRVSLVLLVLGACLTAGCQLFNEKLTADPGPAYPESLPRGSTADVQVFRDVTVLRMTNTTASAYGPGRLWLNQAFSIEAGTLEPGQTWEFPLNQFVDEFGDVYRAGGFFAQRDPAAVVLVEIENGPESDRELVSFVVVENKYN
ncbi:MAG: hypothetical protein AAGA55_03310 [Planctomycetota bacterium]